MSYKNIRTCPVCRMNVESDELTSEYQSIKFNFCTQQCYDAFILRPQLYTHARDRNEVIKQRDLNLEHVLDEAQTTYIEQKLAALMGVKNIEIKGTKLLISYDLLQVTELRIEQELAESGSKLGQGLMEKLRRAWVHYSEDTELDNLESPSAACCNRPPSKT